MCRFDRWYVGAHAAAAEQRGALVRYRAKALVLQNRARRCSLDVVAASIAAQDVPFAEWFAREYPRVVAAAYRVLGERADAEDVAQELFARLARVRRPAPSDGELRVAAVRRALNLLRSRRRRVERELANFRLQRSSQEQTEHAADPLAVLAHSERRAMVHAAMVRIAQRDAEILALRYGGATYREIAEALSVDPAQVGTRLARAERAFKQEILRATR